MEFVLIVLISYLIGSVPFAYVIGMLFFGTDVRRHGSGNLGGSNTGRVLGKKAGVAVMTLDLLKVTLVVFLSNWISSHPWAVTCGVISAGIGHCYPVFLHFKGGKAVAALYGFLFGLWVCLGYSPLVFFLPLITFLVVLFLFKIVSLSSMISSVAVGVYIICIGAPLPIILATVVFIVTIILRHHENIRRMIEKRENKISWM